MDPPFLGVCKFSLWSSHSNLQKQNHLQDRKLFVGIILDGVLNPVISLNRRKAIEEHFVRGAFVGVFVRLSLCFGPYCKRFLGISAQNLEKNATTLAENVN